jgi:hypothetical protein
MSEVITNIGWFLAGAFVMLLVLLALGERPGSRDVDAPAEPVALPDLVPVPVPVVAEPEPAVEPTEVVVPMLVVPPWTEPAEPEPVPVPAGWHDRLEVESMKVVPPWPDVVDDGPGLKPGPGHRRRLELESAPLAPASLPKYPSLVRFKDWDLDDPDRTQMMGIVGGVTADDLDVDLGAPQPLPGFEVDEAARRRLSLPPELIAGVSAPLPSRHAKAEVSA